MARINWQKEFDKRDAECIECYHQIKVLKLQDLICKVAKNCGDEKALMSILGFCAGMMNMRFVDNGIEDMRIEKKDREGAA